METKPEKLETIVFNAKISGVEATLVEVRLSRNDPHVLVHVSQIRDGKEWNFWSRIDMDKRAGIGWFRTDEDADDLFQRCCPDICDMIHRRLNLPPSQPPNCS